MGDKPVPPSTPAPSQRTESIRSGVQWYDSPSVSLERRVKSDIPKNTEMEEDPFFGKKEDDETSNSCDGFGARLPQSSSRKYRRRLRPSSDGINPDRKTEGDCKDPAESEVSSSPASSNSYSATLPEMGRRSLQLMKSRCTAISTTTDACDITTPKRKRKFEDEEEEGEEEEEKEEEGDENKHRKSESTLLTPSLSRGSASKRGCSDGAGTSTDTSLPGTPLACLSLSSVTPRRASGGRISKREELVDTPESSQKEEGKERKGKKEVMEKDKKTIRREKYGDQPNFDSDDSFYDSD